jgi:hypothetical protein
MPKELSYRMRISLTSRDTEELDQFGRPQEREEEICDIHLGPALQVADLIRAALNLSTAQMSMEDVQKRILGFERRVDKAPPAPAVEEDGKYARFYTTSIDDIHLRLWYNAARGHWQVRLEDRDEGKVTKTDIR